MDPPGLAIWNTYVAIYQGVLNKPLYDGNGSLGTKKDGERAQKPLLHL